MKLRKLRKKASLLDWFYIIAVMFLVSIAIIVVMMTMNKINLSGVFTGTPEAQEAFDSAQTTILGFDNAILFILVGLSIFVLVSSYFVWNHPAFFIVGFILLCIAVTVGAIGSNVYEELIESPSITETATNFPKLNFIMTYLPLYIAIMGVLGGVIGYLGYRSA